MPDIPSPFDAETLAKIARLSFRARRIVEGLRAGSHRSPFQGASVEFAEHKEYSPGDDLRRLDWKLFGKSDKYYVKRYEEETNLQAHLLVDSSASMAFNGLIERTSWPERFFSRRGAKQDDQEDGPVSKLEHAALLAASLATLLIGQGDAVGLHILGRPEIPILPPRAGTSQLTTLLEQLALLTPQGQGQIAESLAAFAHRVTRRGLVIVVSDLLETPDTVLSTLETLRTRRNDVVLFHVLHADELSFPYDEVSRFEDPEDRERVLVADPRAIRDGYLAELNAFLETVQKRCFEVQVDYSRVDTGTSVSSALASFLAARVAGRR